MANTIAQNPTVATFFGASSVNKAFASGGTNPSLYVAALTYESQSITATIADDRNAGNYNADSVQSGGGVPGGGTSRVHSKQNTQTSVATVTATLSGSDIGTLQIFEITGAATSSALDSTGGGSGNGTQFDASLTTTSADCTVIVAATQYGGTFAADTGFTESFSVVGGSNAYHWGEYDANVGTAGTKTLQAGLGSVSWSSASAAYKVAGGGGITTVAADTISLTDSALADVTKVAVASDTLTLTATALADASKVATASDTVSLTDSATAGSSFPAIAADTISFTESAVALVAFPAVAADTISLTDSALADASKVAVASDTLTLTDSAEAEGPSLAAVATDTISLTDSALADATKVAAAADTISLTDSALADATKAATASDSVSLTDSADAAIGSQTFTAVAADTIAFTDSAVGSIQAQPVIPQFSGADPDFKDYRKRKKNLRDAIEEAISSFEEKNEEIVERTPAVRQIVQQTTQNVRGSVTVEQIEGIVRAAERNITAIVQKEQARHEKARRDEEDEFLLM